MNSLAFSWILFIVLLCHFSLIGSLNHYLHNLSRSNHFDHFSDAISNPRQMGYVVCAGNKHRIDVMRMIYTFRHVWRTYLPFIIAHCNELDVDFQNQLLRMDPYVQLLNLCPVDHDKTNQDGSSDHNNTLFGMNRKDAEKKLRGFFCKVAALLRSPLLETMILDLDTIWFKNPEKLFYSKSYLENKSLFFRDRLFSYELHGGRIGPDEILDMYSIELGHGYHKLLSKDEIRQLYYDNGINVYFANIYNASYPQFNEHQDSSTVMLDKRQHPKLIQKLEDWLKSFVLGYGDKEIFWVASTIVNESYTWEPFLAGQYGDCMGLIIQFDPSDIELHSPSHALPMYMNAEYMVESKLSVVGEFSQSVMTKPILASQALYNVSLLRHMRSFDQPLEYSGCTCAGYDCVPLKKHINYHIILSQWIVISLRLSRSGPEKDCVPIFVKHIDTLNAIFQRLSASRKECPIIGCPYLPMLRYNGSLVSSISGGSISNINHYNNNRIKNNDKLKICEPVVFNDKPTDEKLLQLTIKARRMPFT